MSLKEIQESRIETFIYAIIDNRRTIIYKIIVAAQSRRGSSGTRALQMQKRYLCSSPITAIGKYQQKLHSQNVPVQRYNYLLEQQFTSAILFYTLELISYCSHRKNLNQGVCSSRSGLSWIKGEFKYKEIIGRKAQGEIFSPLSLPRLVFELEDNRTGRRLHRFIKVSCSYC